MTKKGVKKKSAGKKSSKKKTSHHSAEHHAPPHHPSDLHVEKVLVENFVSLQKVMTNLSVKFDSLSTQISKLLELFEISAKTMAQKDFELGGKNDEEIMKKIDNLLEQNKVIARGLTLLHEPDEAPAVMPQMRIPSAPSQMQRPQPQQMPVQPRPPSQPPMQRAIEEDEAHVNMSQYQKSQHIDESQNLNFDIGRNEKKEKEEKGNDFSI